MGLLFSSIEEYKLLVVVVVVPFAFSHRHIHVHVLRKKNWLTKIIMLLSLNRPSPKSNHVILFIIVQDLF